LLCGHTLEAVESIDRHFVMNNMCRTLLISSEIIMAGTILLTDFHPSHDLHKVSGSPITNGFAIAKVNQCIH
jgi:hypothetical protein